MGAMRAAVIDDLELCRREIRACFTRYIQQTCAGETPVVEEFCCGEDFLARFAPGAYDIVFIDQYMEGLSGLDTARAIRRQDELAALLFVTTSREHAIESYGVRACGYLVKPFQYEDFAQAMALARLGKIRSARFIRIEQQKLLLREILWCGQDDHYVEVHTDKRGVLRFRIPFGALTGLLAPYPQFLTCYKCRIVNMERAERTDGAAFVLDTGERVPFALRDRKKIEALFDDYLFQREREEEML